MLLKLRKIPGRDVNRLVGNFCSCCKDVIGHLEQDRSRSRREIVRIILLQSWEGMRKKLLVGQNAFLRPADFVLGGNYSIGSNVIS